MSACDVTSPMVKKLYRSSKSSQPMLQMSLLPATRLRADCPRQLAAKCLHFIAFIAFFIGAAPSSGAAAFFFFMAFIAFIAFIAFMAFIGAILKELDWQVFANQVRS